MHREHEDVHDELELVDEDESDNDDVELDDVDIDDEDTDNVGDASVEINVEQLIADIEGSGDKVSERQKEVRRRLEEIAEEKSFDETYAIEFDKD